MVSRNDDGMCMCVNGHEDGFDHKRYKQTTKQISILIFAVTKPHVWHPEQEYIIATIDKWTTITRTSVTAVEINEPT